MPFKPFTPLQKPSEMSSELRKNCVACYEVQNLCSSRGEITDSKDLAEIDRQLIDYLLEIDGKPIEIDGEKVTLLDHVELTEWEISGLRYRRILTERMRDKLRIFASRFTYSTNGA